MMSHREEEVYERSETSTRLCSAHSTAAHGTPPSYFAQSKTFYLHLYTKHPPQNNEAEIRLPLGCRFTLLGCRWVAVSHSQVKWGPCGGGELLKEKKGLRSNFGQHVLIFCVHKYR